MSSRTLSRFLSLPAFTFFPVFTFLLVFTWTGCAQETAPDPDRSTATSGSAPELAPEYAAQEEEPPPVPVRPDSIALSWGIDTNEGAYGMPMSIINLRAGGVRFPVASGPGMRDMTDEERARFRAPEGALAAAGYWAGFGVNVLVTQEDGWIRILETTWDEEQDVSASWDYQETAAISVRAIIDYRENAVSQPGWVACFDGQHEVTSYAYDIIAEGGRVTADVEFVIEDDRNAYYTAAQSTAGGAQIGDLLFMELYTTIEDDRQNTVEIWRVDDPANPHRLIIDNRSFEPCTEG